MGILIFSDIVPDATRENAYTAGELEKLLSAEIVDKINNADYNIVNLECPLTDSEERIYKWGSHLKASPECVNLLRKFHNLIVNLANNHIRDYGDRGVRDTIQILKKNDIIYLGAGNNKDNILTEQIVNINEKKIAVYACAENEFSGAGENNAGANTIDIGKDIFNLQQLKKKADYVIVLYHGGVEFYPYPTPRMQKRLREYIIAGADLVVCQHSHCIGCKEEYAGGCIVYGQGNFLFGDRAEVKLNISDYSAWKKGMVVEVDPDSWQVDFLYYTVTDGKVVLDNNDIEEEKMKKRSEQLLKEDFLKTEWEQYCIKNRNYMEIFRKDFLHKRLSLKSRIKRALLILAGKDNYAKEEYLRIKNYLSCESHLELLETNCDLEIDKRSKDV